MYEAASSLSSLPLSLSLSSSFLVTQWWIDVSSSTAAVDAVAASFLIIFDIVNDVPTALDRRQVLAPPVSALEAKQCNTNLELEKTNEQSSRKE